MLRAHIILASLFLLTLCGTPHISHAQFGSSGLNLSTLDPISGLNASLPGLNAQASITSQPAYPEPYSEVVLTLQAPAADTQGATIRWYIDQEEEIGSFNQRSHTLTVENIGDTTDVHVVIEKLNGTTEDIYYTLQPVQVDITLEALTSVPAFYRGRALPSRGASVHATAIAHTGTNIDLSNLNYKWEVDNTVVGGGTIHGMNTTNFQMPLSNTASVRVTISDGKDIIVERTINVKAAEPEIIFYEDNPLRGLVPQAFENRKTVIGNQITVRAEPYYISLFADTTDFEIQWTINGSLVNNTGSDEINEITLRGSGTNSIASIRYQMFNMTTLGQMVRNNFELVFDN